MFRVTVVAAAIVMVVAAARRGQEAFRIVAEPGAAARRAEPVGRAAVAHVVRAVRRHGHAANRVDFSHGQMLVRARTAINSSTSRGNSSPLSLRAASATQ